jgi:hypothetical protein
MRSGATFVNRELASASAAQSDAKGSLHRWSISYAAAMIVQKNFSPDGLEIATSLQIPR